METAAQWVAALSLLPHPEGGYFKETYRANDMLPVGVFGDRFSGPRNACTGIYYLLEAGDFSAFHRIRSDEMWHFYAGGALELHMLDQRGHRMVRIGRDVLNGEVLQFVVPAGTWFAATPAPASAFSLLGCTVSPGFDFADFEMAGASDLTQRYPAHADIVTRFSR